MTKTNLNRRDFVKGAASVAAVSAIPLSTVELAFADPAKNFTFAYICDRANRNGIEIISQFVDNFCLMLHIFISVHHQRWRESGGGGLDEFGTDGAHRALQEALPRAR